MADMLGVTSQVLRNHALVSFKAGKMTKVGSTVTADPRRGRLQLVVSPEDSLTHLQWRARGSTSDLPEVDLIMFPGEAHLLRVQSTADRVYVLKWQQTDTRMFFWMQEPDQATDQANVDAINRILSEGLSQAVERNPNVESMPDSQAVHSLNNEHSSAHGAETGDPTNVASSRVQGSVTQRTSTAPVTLDGLQRAMASIGGSSSAAGETPLLSDLLHPDVILPVLGHPSMAGCIQDLRELLPMEDQDDPSSISEVLSCSTVRAQAAALTNALASGSTAELLASFGMPEDPAATAGAVGAAGIRAFLRSLSQIAKTRRRDS